MASKVFVELMKDMESIISSKRPSKVTVTTKNKSYTCRIDLPDG